MSELVKLEKRFENILEKLEFALLNKELKAPVKRLVAEDEVKEVSEHNVDELINKIEQLETAAKNDATEIDRLVRNLKEILETDND